MCRKQTSLLCVQAMVVSCNVPKVQFPMHLSSLQRVFYGFPPVSGSNTYLCGVEKQVYKWVSQGSCMHKAKLTLCVFKHCGIRAFFREKFLQLCAAGCVCGRDEKGQWTFFMHARGRGGKLIPRYAMCRAMKTGLFCQHFGTFVLYLLKREVASILLPCITTKPPPGLKADAWCCIKKYHKSVALYCPMDVYNQLKYLAVTRKSPIVYSQG